MYDATFILASQVNGEPHRTGLTMQRGPMKRVVSLNWRQISFKQLILHASRPKRSISDIQTDDIMSNKAAWRTASKAKPLKVDVAPLPKAGKGEVVIKNHAIAVNPADWKIQV